MAIVSAANARKDIPLVSIIAICYNHSRYLEETLNSILNQTYANIELIIIDSNSPDNSVRLIESWIEMNKVECVFIKQTEPKNICQNLNQGLSLASGAFFQGISCDDILLPKKIETQILEIQNHPSEVILSYTGVNLIDERGDFIEYKLITRPNNTFDSDYEKLAGGTYFFAPSALLSRRAVDEGGGYDESLFYEDWDMALRLAGKGKFLGIDKPLTEYRIHPVSMTNAYNFNYCLTALKISDREYKLSGNPLFRDKSFRFARKIIKNEYFLPDRLGNYLSRIFPSIYLIAVKMLYIRK